VEVKRALVLAKKAAEFEPKNAAYVDTLAEAYFRNGFHEEAVKTQKSAVELAPEGQREELQKRL
jgi:Flp pilus assembly protein TadD